MQKAGTAVCDARLIYDLRYDKKCEFGFEELNQKANHLITTMGALRTEDQNFNFVFAIDDATRTSLWENLYSFLPLILFHAVQVVEALMGNLARRVDEEIDITPLRTITGFLLWLEDGQWKSETTAARKQLGETLVSAGLSCPACGTQFEFHEPNLTLLYKEGALSCSSCSQKLDFLSIELSADQTHINRGLILVEYNQLEEAEGEFRAALKANPDNAAAHVNLGVTLSMRGLDAEAEAGFRSAIRLAPEDADLHINLGSFLERQDRKEEAEREYRTALQIDSENAFAFYKLGRLLAELGRKKEADAASQMARQMGFPIEDFERSFSKDDR